MFQRSMENTRQRVHMGNDMGNGMVTGMRHLLYIA